MTINSSVVVRESERVTVIIGGVIISGSESGMVITGGVVIRDSGGADVTVPCARDVLAGCG